MGAEWPAGAALAMESWPTRSRGLMSGILQGIVEPRLPAIECRLRLFYSYLGWRGMLWIGILPALAVCSSLLLRQGARRVGENPGCSASRTASVRAAS